MHSDEPSAIRDLWGLRAPATKGPRPRVDVHAIARAAVAIADEEGFDAVTLASVARAVGLTTTALYRHLDSKDTLVELMIDHALGAPPVPGSVMEAVGALWGRQLAHPWLASVPVTRAPRAPHALAWMDTLVGLLAADGVEDPLGTALAIDTLVRGYAPLARLSQAAPFSADLAAEIATRYPALVEGAARERPVIDELNDVIRRLLATASHNGEQ